jgi:hypothetical protein
MLTKLSQALVHHAYLLDVVQNMIVIKFHAVCHDLISFKSAASYGDVFDGSCVLE